MPPPSPPPSPPPDSPESPESPDSPDAAKLPSALRANARWLRLGPTPGNIPALITHPDWAPGHLAPVVIWMHGRTVNKELDPGRYLRWMRATGGGIGAR